MASFSTSYLPTDEEEERLAEIEALTSGFGRDFAAGMAAGGIDVGAGDPEPVDPRAGLPAPTPFGQRSQPDAVPAPRPDAPDAAPPTWARGMAPMTDPSRTSLPTPPDSEGDDLRRRIAALEVPESRSDRHRRGRLMMAAQMQGLSPQQTRELIGPSREEQLGELRSMLEARDQRRQQERAEIAAGLDRQQAMADRERRFSLEQARLDETRRYHDAVLGQRGEQFAARETQDMKQDELRGRRAQRRTDTMAGAIGGGGRQGTPRVDPAVAADGEDPAAAAAREEQMRTALRSYETRDFELYSAARYGLQARGVDPDSPDGQRAMYLSLRPYDQQGVMGSVRGRTATARNTAIDNLRGGETTGLRIQGMQDAQGNRAQGQIDRLARDTQDYVNDARSARNAGRAMRRLVQALGPEGAAIVRRGGTFASAVARANSPEAEAAAAELAEYASYLLHERGGASVTESEERRILAGIAAGNMVASPEATIAALEAVARRADAQRDYVLSAADPAVRAEFEARQRGGGRSRSGRQTQQGGETVVREFVGPDGVRYRVVRGADGQLRRRRVQ